jgi:thioredoxin
VNKNYLSGLITVLVLSTILGLIPGTAISVAVAEQLELVPVQGMVTMVDLGAKKCIPCKMMAPIMEELEKEYVDRAAIVFIDVWENPDAGRKYHIKLIPTQIFYDAKGKESYRHEGFMDKNAIVAELTKLGVK